MIIEIMSADDLVRYARPETALEHQLHAALKELMVEHQAYIEVLDNYNGLDISSVENLDKSIQALFNEIEQAHEDLLEANNTIESMRR